MSDFMPESLIDPSLQNTLHFYLQQLLWSELHFLHNESVTKVCISCL